MAQNPHEYLIEQLQYTGEESVGSSSNKLKLNFNHPCKELIWVVQPDAHVDYCESFVGGKQLYKAMGAQPWNYTDAVDALPNSILAFSSMEGVSGLKQTAAGRNKEFINADGLFKDPGAGGIDAEAQNSGSTEAEDTLNDANAVAAEGFLSGDAINSGVSDAGAFVLAETAKKLHCWGLNPVVTAKLQLNGQDRFSEREGSYFDVVQPFQHHTRHPDTGINLYSFALRPEEHQPSGTCNFSRIDNASLQLVLSAAAIGDALTAKVRIYATNYNVLRIMSGMGGLAYSN
jgi:hypothetical protein